MCDGFLILIFGVELASLETWSGHPIKLEYKGLEAGHLTVSSLRFDEFKDTRLDHAGDSGMYFEALWLPSLLSCLQYRRQMRIGHLEVCSMSFLPASIQFLNALFCFAYFNAVHQHVALRKP